ncbi:shikimate dehydrogenase [Erysipelotrichaceae bacterium I46]|uniref:shikimate kinase n=1 Tax=Clostridium innocuum TaxID=1522 RepID=UPI00080C75FD|nr:shikimate kinase [[Clostridium] innocuum]ANU69624.1 shikimate dehydrogenase [Erysipelotrichaceae bacterium I46]ASU17939.1 shikimate dehydrogenase [[Clostridium] innocuum]QQR26487.1 shikimate dehydrogenase [[Clostridium] innocuum]
MRYGLIGEKLGHSFSKDIHERIADYTFDLIPLSKEEFKTFMEKKEFTALNVTIPYKKDVIPYLDEMDEHAKAIGAVNTIVNRDGKLKGYNTDFTGFLYMVKKHNVHMEGKKVLIIGNGGASAAIQAVVQHELAGSMVIVDVVPGNGAISYDEMFSSHLDAEIIINTSPIGMYPRIGNAPIDISMFHKCEAVLDVIYNPILTRLCFEAQEMDIKRVNGLEMLIAQAKQSVEFFLDKRIDDQIIDDIYQDMLRERCNIVLIGMPSAGKTTIGKMLEDCMQKEFIDLDDIIIEKAGKSIPEIFEESGEAGFRAIETEAAIEVSKLNNKIIATGGGTIKHKVNMDYLRQNGITIFIDRDVDKLISSDPNRPLSKSSDALAKMHAERLPLYQKYAAYVAVNNSDIESTVTEIVEAYHSILIDAVSD